jgi:hypothetical protein
LLIASDTARGVTVLLSRRALANRTRELKEARADRDRCAADATVAKDERQDAAHTLARFERELNAALEELETNRQYVRIGVFG